MSTEQHISPSAIVTKAGVGVDGPGYLAGEHPAGRTTVNGTPVSADVDVFYELDNKDWQCVASTTSQPDGTWSIVGLNPDKKFNVVARHASFGGVIAVDVQPSRTDVVALSGAFTTNKYFNGVDGFMTVESGMPPFTASVVDPLPYGLTPLVGDGRKLVIEGTSDDVGLWDSVVRVTDSNGVFADAPVEVEIKKQNPRFWRILMTEDVWEFYPYGKACKSQSCNSTAFVRWVVPLWHPRHTKNHRALVFRALSTATLWAIAYGLPNPSLPQLVSGWATSSLHRLLSIQ